MLTEMGSKQHARGCLRSASGALIACGLFVGGCAWGEAGPYAGRVVDADGKGLAGAVIASDQATTLSEGDGRFLLANPHGTVTVRKIRYQERQVDPARDTIVTLISASRSVKVAWDQRWQAPAMGGLMTHLQTQGFDVHAIASGDLPSGQDVYVLPTPAWFTPEAYQRYLRLAEEGGKIVLLGEWGGYDGIDITACNALGAKAGISFATAMIRTYESDLAQEWLTVRSFGTSSLGQEMKQGLRLFTAGALDVSPPAMPLLQTGTQGVRIQAWSLGVQTLCAAGPCGRGMLLALSDTSMWTDETAADGIPHWRTLDNARFAVNLLNW